MKKKMSRQRYGRSVLAAGLALTMAFGGQTAALAAESQSFSAKDGVIDEQTGDVYYEIFVRAFRDSDGDHIGDFKGIEEQVPYLAELGITGIWLMPITDSGSEHGYDVRNYYETNSDYGTMEEFESMLATCHEYGIKVIMDLVVNHCGCTNVWFQEALKGPTLEDGSENPYWNYFTFLPTDANYVEKTAAEIHDEEVAYLEEHGSMEGYEAQYPLYDNATQGPDKTVWRSTEDFAQSMIEWGLMEESDRENIIPGYNFLAIFGSGVPDLNYASEELREEIKDVAAYWLEAGVDGFRLDAARHIYGDFYSNIYSDYIFEENMEYWRDFRASLEAEYPDVYLVGEVWEKNTDNVVPFVSDGGLHSIFNFNLSGKIYEAVSNESTAYDPEAATDASRVTDDTDLNLVSELIEYYNKLGEVSDYSFIDCPFITNHDQNRLVSLLKYQFDETADDIFTAAILTDEEGNPLLRDDADKAESRAKVAADILLTLPGKPFLYYGEEIGMDGTKPDSIIRGMAWFEEPFTEDGTSQDGLANYRDVVYSLGGEQSVEAQLDDPNSMLAHYKEVIQTRKAIPALSNGDLDEYPLESQEVVSYIRMTEDQRVLVVINLTGNEQALEITADPNYGEFTSVVYQASVDTASKLDGQSLILAPYSMMILE